MPQCLQDISHESKQNLTWSAKVLLQITLTCKSFHNYKFSFFYLNSTAWMAQEYIFCFLKYTVFLWLMISSKGFQYIARCIFWTNSKTNADIKAKFGLYADVIPLNILTYALKLTTGPGNSTRKPFKYMVP